VHICGLYHSIIVMRYLGIDYGTKKIGLALSDEAGTMGFPHAILYNSRKLVDDLLSIISEKKVESIIIGESHNLFGVANPVAKAAHVLGDALFEHSGIPVYYESEVYTSIEARRAPEKEGKSRAPKKHINVDASAAALILTSYLSKQHHG